MAINLYSSPSHIFSFLFFFLFSSDNFLYPRTFIFPFSSALENFSFPPHLSPLPFLPPSRFSSLHPTSPKSLFDFDLVEKEAFWWWWWAVVKIKRGSKEKRGEKKSNYFIFISPMISFDNQFILVEWFFAFIIIIIISQDNYRLWLDEFFIYIKIKVYRGAL